MDERIPYAEIRAWFLNCYYVYCQGKISSHEGWVADEHEVGYAYSEFDGSFELPIERLMLEVLALILACGRLPVADVFHRGQIATLLAEHSMDEMLRDIPAEEARELLHDMRLLKLL